MSKVRNKKDVSQSFLKGALVLSISMVAVKICGLLQKVLLANLYGSIPGDYAAFGVGLFSNAYELYVPLFTLATVGFPTAISRLISESYAKERYNDVKQIYRVGKPFFIALGVVCFLIMTVGSFFYINIIQSPYSLLAMLVLAPTIFFGCMTSLYRGYFEGMRNMTPTATSEVIEAVSKIAIGVVLSYIIVNVGVNQYETTGTIFGLGFENEKDAYNTLVSFSVAGSILGITLGSVFSFLYLYIKYKRYNRSIPEEYYRNSVEALSKKETFSKMWRTALPVGIGALVMSIVSSVDAMIIQKLIYNMAVNNASELMNEFNNAFSLTNDSGKITIHTEIWGIYGSALTLISIVVAVTQVFGTSAMPNVTRAFTRGNKDELRGSVESVLLLTTVVTFPCALGLSVLARPILALVYSSPEISTFGYESLQVLGIAVLFMGMLTPICSMIQGIGKPKITMYIYVFGTTLKVIVSFFFARIISINIVGSAIGSLVAYIIMCTVAMYMLIKHTKIVPNFMKVMVKPMISAIVCAVCAYMTHYILGLHVLISIVISAIFYIAVLFILHTFEREDVIMLPKGKKIVIILEKLHLIR